MLKISMYTEMTKGYENKVVSEKLMYLLSRIFFRY